ncbi:hypothetical protein AVEN_252505-1 [Araneus ventricosus]|uniref:Uncharacterized protein n=1 Tax=Araneus ventricosus TaxID=182803 RepID=A0A4Y2ATN8_ARAVE|nr:hypothetical protein AVEN_252505-1 [Araneus ventricosus]
MAPSGMGEEASLDDEMRPDIEYKYRLAPGRLDRCCLLSPRCVHTKRSTTGPFSYFLIEMDTGMVSYATKVFTPHWKNFQNEIVRNNYRPFDPRNGEDIDTEIQKFTIDHKNALDNTG